MGKTLTEEDIEKIYRLRFKGLTILNISLEIGTSTHTVRKYLRKGYKQWEQEEQKRREEKDGTLHR